DRETRLTAEHPYGVTQVALQIVQPGHSVPMPDVFANAIDVAQFKKRLAAGLLGGHAGGHVFIHFVGDVRFPLPGQLNVLTMTAKEPANSDTQLLTDYSAARASTRPMACTSCSQRLVSASSCLRPLAVSL